MNINEATSSFQANRLALHYDDRTIVGIWSPHTPVPPAVRRTVHRHRQQLLEIMHAGCIDTCTSPDLHRKSWHDNVCVICLRIDKSILEHEEKSMPITQLKRKQR